jgi:acetolactate synthase-1/2/3 large subunit
VYGGRIIGSELQNPDFVKLAESFGAIGRRVQGPAALEAAITEGFKADVPTVIDIPTGVLPNPWPVFRPAKARG